MKKNVVGFVQVFFLSFSRTDSKKRIGNLKFDGENKKLLQLKIKFKFWLMTFNNHLS